MKIQLKSLAPMALGLAFAITGPSAFAKGHDQGVADGTKLVENTGLFSSGGTVAGVFVDGIGGGKLCTDRQVFFCGVASNLGLTYGRDIVSVEPELQRVDPVVGGGRDSRGD